VKSLHIMFSRFDRIPACVRRTDRRTSCDGIEHRAVKISETIANVFAIYNRPSSLAYRIAY